MSSPSADVLKISILGSESIHVGFHLIPYIFNTILTNLPASSYVLVTDTNLSKLYLPEIKAAFDEASQETGSKARFLSYEVSPGEEAKSRRVKEQIEDWMLEEKCTRDTVFLAFGGGVVGDLTGFVAATLWVTSEITRAGLMEVCAESSSSRSRPLCSQWSILQWEERLRSTHRMARTLLGPSGSRVTYSSIWRF